MFLGKFNSKRAACSDDDYIYRILPTNSWGSGFDIPGPPRRYDKLNSQRVGSNHNSVSIYISRKSLVGRDHAPRNDFSTANTVWPCMRVPLSFIYGRYRFDRQLVSGEERDFNEWYDSNFDVFNQNRGLFNGHSIDFDYPGTSRSLEFNGNGRSVLAAEAAHHGNFFTPSTGRIIDNVKIIPFIWNSIGPSYRCLYTDSATWSAVVQSAELHIAEFAGTTYLYLVELTSTRFKSDDIGTADVVAYGSSGSTFTNSSVTVPAARTFDMEWTVPIIRKFKINKDKQSLDSLVGTVNPTAISGNKLNSSLTNDSYNTRCIPSKRVRDTFGKELYLPTRQKAKMASLMDYDRVDRRMVVATAYESNTPGAADPSCTIPNAYLIVSYTDANTFDNDTNKSCPEQSVGINIQNVLHTERIRRDIFNIHKVSIEKWNSGYLISVSYNAFGSTNPVLSTVLIWIDASVPLTSSAVQFVQYIPDAGYADIRVV